MACENGESEARRYASRCALSKIALLAPYWPHSSFSFVCLWSRIKDDCLVLRLTVDRSGTHYTSSDNGLAGKDPLPPRRLSVWVTRYQR